MDYAVNGRIAERNGNRDPDAAPHGVFPCTGDDEWVAITVFNDHEWQAFCQASGHAEWITDPRFATFLARKDNEDELEKLIAQWTANQTAEKVEDMLQKAGVPAHKVLKSSEIMSDSQMVHRGYYVRMDHCEMGNVAYDFQASFILSKTPRKLDRPSPCLGEHNEWVFKDLLGMTDDEISEYLLAGAITTEA
jgi:benzylsuccinate CoA-transferase BbsF subunit